jgi:hypothetical protein
MITANLPLTIGCHGALAELYATIRLIYVNMVLAIANEVGLAREGLKIYQQN